MEREAADNLYQEAAQLLYEDAVAIAKSLINWPKKSELARLNRFTELQQSDALEDRLGAELYRLWNEAQLRKKQANVRSS